MNENNEIDAIRSIQKDILWGLYQDYREHARHSESARESANNFMLAISAAVITVIAAHDPVTCQDKYLCMLLIILGLLGIIFSVSYIDRYHRNRKRASTVKDKLDKLFFESETLKKIKNDSDDNYYQEFGSIGSIFKFLSKTIFNTHIIGILFPLAILFLGIILALQAPTNC